MARRPTIADVAKAAGVSTATVDRVLNNRRPVKLSTVEAVLDASRRLGFRRTHQVESRAEELLQRTRLGFVLQKSSKTFYVELAKEIRCATQSLLKSRGRVEIEFVEELAPEPIVRAMATLARRVDSMAVVSVDHPLVADEIRRLKGKGIPVWALLSDLTSHDKAGYIGIDGRKAGRTAGWTLSRFCPAGSKIGTLIGSHRYNGHEDRDAGLRAYVREAGLDLHVLQSVSYSDSIEGAHSSALSLISRHPDLAGLHVIGGGAEGAVRALNECGLAEKVACVCHDRTQGTRMALLDGSVVMVIAAPAERIAKSAVSLLATTGSGPGPGDDGALPVIPFDMLISENL